MSVVAVTGSTGFLGSHLAEALAERGDHVRGLLRDPSKPRFLPTEKVEPVAGRLHDREAIARLVSGAKVVFHSAALTKSKTEEEMFRVNLDGTRTVLEACLAAETPPTLVFISSQAAAGPSTDGSPMTEESPARPRSAYGRSKLEAERLIESHADRLPVVVVRPPAIYGPRDDAFLVLFEMAAKGWLPRPLGARRLAIAHVDDVVRGTMLAADHGSGIFYVTDGEDHPLDEVLSAIATSVREGVKRVPIPPPLFLTGVWFWERFANLTGRRPAVTLDRAREMLSLDWICSDERARRELGYANRWKLADGIRATAEWYRREGWL